MMAKTTSAKKNPAPSKLVLKLNAPGMTTMHRVGLGGLAATLRNLSKRRKKPEQNRETFEHPCWHEEFSWDIQPTEITLDFCKPEWAGDFLRWLFEFSFRIDENGMIYLPGQYKGTESLTPDSKPEICARLQSGLTLTFLQHGKTRTLAKTETEKSYDFGEKTIRFTYKECQDYSHQTAWKEWVKDGKLVPKNHSVKSQFNPGAVIRHNAFKQSELSQPIELILPLAFAIVGAIALPTTGKSIGVLIVPYVEDLTVFANMRPRITPDYITKTYISSPGDAVLRFDNECRGVEIAKKTKTFGCDVMTFRTMPWATQQKLRSAALSVTSVDEEFSEFFRTVLIYLPPRIIEKKTEEKSGRGKDAVKSEKVDYFWTDSVVRPFVADNLVLGRYWFEGFTALFNDSTNREKLSYKDEKKGLNKMVNDEKLDWRLKGARTLVLAVQESLKRCYAKAVSDSSLSGKAKGNRFEKEYDKWRIAFSGAKTPEQIRYALSDMFSRAKHVPTLEEGWGDITELLLKDWQAARDLALIGLASYRGTENKNDNTDETEEVEE